MLRPLVAVLAVALTLWCTVVPAQDGGAMGTPLEGTVPAQWRLVWTGDPQHRVLVAWSTREEGSTHRVHLDREPRGADPGAYARHVDAGENGRYSADDPVAWYHHAEVTGLEPDTVYWLCLESDAEVSRELHFRTAPAEDRPFAFLSGGDSRSNREMRRTMNRRVAALAAGDEELLCFAHGGDYVYSGSVLDQWMAWLTDHELTTAEDGRVLPVVPTRGNHEASGPLFDEVWGTPGGGLGRNYFATSLSPEVLLVTLNTERAAGGDQGAFLEKTLAGSEHRWKLVQYHRPIFPAVKRPHRSKPVWQPLFEEHGVSLVLESDGHTLKRTVPVLGAEQHEEGVVYIGEGGMGVPQRTPDDDRWFLQDPGTCASAHHVWMVAVKGERLELCAFGPEGAVLDRCTLEPRATAGR